MISKESKIFLTVYIGGESLVRPGVYESANINVFNPLTADEKVVVIEPMRTISEPVFSRATKSITLGWPFIEAGLERPHHPRNKNAFQRFLKTPEGKAWQNWNKLSDKQKLEFRVQKFCDDMHYELMDFEVLE